VTNVAFSFETSPNKNPKRKKWGDMANYVPPCKKSVGYTSPLSPHQIAPMATRTLLFSDETMSCCAAGTNWCLDFRRRAFALGEQVSAEWSRSRSSMVRRARDSLAPLRRSSAVWMPARMGRLSAGGGRRHPITIRKASL